MTALLTSQGQTYREEEVSAAHKEGKKYSDERNKNHQSGESTRNISYRMFVGRDV